MSSNAFAPPPEMTPEEMFLAYLPFVEGAVAYIAKRHHLIPEDAEDFASEVKLKLIEDDYAVFRKFKGSSKLETYLTACINFRFKDRQNSRWGKWRPCAEAKRLGPIGILLDRLTSRDGNSLEQACEVLRKNLGVTLSKEELERLAARLPPRAPKRVEVDCEDHLQDRPSADASPEEQAIETQRQRAWEKVKAALARARLALPKEDQLLLKMWTEDDLSVAQIARALRCEQKPLYRRLEKLKERLKKALEADGIRPGDLPDLLR